MGKAIVHYPTPTGGAVALSDKATSQEAAGLANDTKWTTPLKVKAAIDAAKVYATQAEAEQGTLSGKDMSPLRVKQSIDKNAGFVFDDENRKLRMGSPAQFDYIDGSCLDISNKRLSKIAPNGKVLFYSDNSPLALYAVYKDNSGQLKKKTVAPYPAGTWNCSLVHCDDNSVFFGFTTSTGGYSTLYKLYTYTPDAAGAPVFTEKGLVGTIPVPGNAVYIESGNKGIKEHISHATHLFIGIISGLGNNYRGFCLCGIHKTTGAVTTLANHTPAYQTCYGAYTTLSTGAAYLYGAGGGANNFQVMEGAIKNTAGGVLASIPITTAGPAPGCMATDGSGVIYSAEATGNPQMRKINQSNGAVIQTVTLPNSTLSDRMTLVKDEREGILLLSSTEVCNSNGGLLRGPKTYLYGLKVSSVGIGFEGSASLVSQPVGDFLVSYAACSGAGKVALNGDHRAFLSVFREDV